MGGGRGASPPLPRQPGPPQCFPPPPLLCFDLTVSCILPSPSRQPHTLGVRVHSDLPVSKQDKARIPSLDPHQGSHGYDRRSWVTLSAPSLCTHPSCVPRTGLSAQSARTLGAGSLFSRSTDWETGAGGGCPLGRGLWLPRGSSLREAPALNPALLPPPRGEALPDGLQCSPVMRSVHRQKSSASTHTRFS